MLVLIVNGIVLSMVVPSYSNTCNCHCGHTYYDALQMTVPKLLMDQKLIRVFHVKISMPTVESKMAFIGSG